VKRLVALAGCAAVLLAAGASASPVPRLDPSFGIRPATDDVYCFMTFAGGRWSGFLCFRPRNGFFVRMVSRDLSAPARVWITRGFDDRLRGHRDRRVQVLRVGRSWASSDAEVVKCRSRRGELTCRHYLGGRFVLGRMRGSRIVQRH
jgi:hypothetical protein